MDLEKELLEIGFERHEDPLLMKVDPAYYNGEYNYHRLTDSWQDYHITVSVLSFGNDERHTCHIDGSDMSTVGFAYVKTIRDINLILEANGLPLLGK